MNASKVGFILLGISAFVIFAFKIVTHFDTSPSVDAAPNEFVIFLPFIFAIASVLILNKLLVLLDMIIFFVVLAASYSFIVPIYLGSL